MISKDNRPPPVLGLFLAGAILILLEGLIELGLFAYASSYSIPTAFFVIPGLTIALGVALLLLSVAYAASPSGTLGLFLLILGGLSFLLGAGFVVGGVLIVVAGALAVFAEWISDELAPRPSRLTAPGASNVAAAISGSSPAAGNASAEEISGVSAKIVVYRPCPSCGELNPPNSLQCLSCGKTFD